MALGALEALRARGLRVPEDVAVVGFDDLDDAKFATPPLTTVRQAPRQLGIEAVRLVLARLRGETCGDVVMETLLQIRQSCGCFRGTRRGDPEPPAQSGQRPRRPDYAAWAGATAARGPAPHPSLPRDWSERMVAAIRRDLERGRSGSFLATVDEIIGGAAEVGNVSAWHQPIATLRREVIRDLSATTAELALAESIFESTHILIGDHAERVQGRRRLATEAAFRALEDLGSDVRTSLDRPSIGRALAAALARPPREELRRRHRPGGARADRRRSGAARSSPGTTSGASRRPAGAWHSGRARCCPTRSGRRAATR